MSVVSVVFTSEGLAADVLTPEIMQKLTQGYDQVVRPTIEAKCVDCHSSRTHFPSYYKIPGVKQLIDRDIAQARRHIDFSSGFPIVQDRALLKKSLTDLRGEIDESEMPPLLYRIMHPATKVNDIERAAILTWIDDLLKAL